MIVLSLIFITWGLAIFFDSLMDAINFRGYGGFAKGGIAWHVVKILMQICFCVTILLAYQAPFIFGNSIQMIMVIGGTLTIETGILQYLFYHILLK